MPQCAICDQEIESGEGSVLRGEQLARASQVTLELAKSAGMEESVAEERLSRLREKGEAVICARCHSVISGAPDPKRYWRANIKVIAVLLLIWATVSYGCSILFIEQLNQFKIGKLPLGFWFSQQGSIYVFVILIFVYAFIMDRLDRRYGVKE